MVNNKIFDHRPINELMAIVKNDFSKFDAEGLIDDGNLIKTVMYCNERLGITIREIREIAIPVYENRAELPLDFEKLFFTCALEARNTLVTDAINPFDNHFDADAVYEACLDRESLGCVDNYRVEIKRNSKTIIHNYHSWIPLSVDTPSTPYCHIDCPNKRKQGKYTVKIKDGYIETPFRAGTLYVLYVGMMKDSEGNITFPFHPLITPYYEWSIKEEILSKALFNSDATNIGELYKLAQQERKKAWLDAFNFTTTRGYGEEINAQRKRELGWYHEWFKYFQ